MKRIILSLHDQTLELRCPDSAACDVEAAFLNCLAPDAAPQRSIEISEDGAGRYALASGGEVVADLTRSDLMTFVMDAVVRELITDIDTAVALHAGAVRHNAKGVLVAGASGSGKSSVVAWLLDRGFDYLSDEICVLTGSEGDILGLPRALVLKPGSVEKIRQFEAFRDAPSVATGSHLMLSPGNLSTSRPHRAPCGLILFPRFAANASARFQMLTSGQCAMRLVESNLNARNLADGGFAAITALARSAPAVAFDYGSFDDLQGRLDVLVRVALDSGPDAAEMRRCLSSFAPARAPATNERAAARSEIPASSPRRTRSAN